MRKRILENAQLNPCAIFEKKVLQDCARILVTAQRENGLDDAEHPTALGKSSFILVH